MSDIGQKLSRSFDVARNVTALFQHRLQSAQTRFSDRVQGVVSQHSHAEPAAPRMPWEWVQDWTGYLWDSAQRGVLFWDALRQRGNNFLAHTRAGLPPVLHFESEIVMDGRTLERPVNYALLRIIPPAGVTVDAKRRPYIVIDPRAGHGPGIGGFKDDSQVGVALREGHPVYFVIFFPEPQPGQTLLDVCDAEARFVHRVRELHPDSSRPVIVGNCQGGWAAMMLAASHPDDTGPIAINGAPMSYWGGAWQEGDSDNPMRYAGGMLGGTWLASLTADLGNGKFDGAWLVQNFENLNLANTFWDKYYHVYANADTEPPRFLEFERWWGGFYLMNREEIEWITQNLFVGNKLWSGATAAGRGEVFDLRNIKAPIVLFVSMGDNITPPQQAFNWVADVYGSTDEIKARGQVIVGLLHQDVGHLGIFVSGKVAKKEHAQIVSVLKSIEALPPGLYGMQIVERKGEDGATEYDVQFVERQLEDLAKLLNRFQRKDEQAFEAVSAVSEFNQRAYELFAQPVIQATANEYTAKLGREFHPLRFQRWAVSDLNPWLAWLGPAAEAVKAQRAPAAESNPLRQAEKAGSDMIGAWLDYVRDVRDAVSEALFFQTYGNLFGLYLAEKHAAQTQQAALAPRDLPFVQEALASIEQGGYAEALTRIGALLAECGAPVPLDRMHLKQELMEEYAEYLPDMPRDASRRIRGEQEIIVRYEPEKALATLPKLLSDPADRARLVALLDKLLADPRMQPVKLTVRQQEMLDAMREVLAAPTGPRLAASSRRVAKSA